MEHHNLISSGIFSENFRDKGSREWTEEAWKTLEEATELYMVEVIADSSFVKQQLTSGRYSTYFLLWPDKEVGYS